MAGASLQARLVGTGDVRLPRLDYTLLGCAVALAMLGLVMVSSASITMADRELGHPFYYALRQAVFIGLGGAAGLGLFRVRLALLERMGMVLLLGAFLMLLLVLVPGVGMKVNGSVRWINAGLFRLQVSEPAKLLFCHLPGQLPVAPWRECAHPCVRFSQAAWLAGGRLP